MSNDTSLHKRCTKCKTEYPSTNEFFSTCKHTKDKLQSWCRACIREANRKNLSNPEKREAHNKRIRERIKTRYINDAEFRAQDNKRTREKQRVYRADPDYRADLNKKARERRKDPIYHAEEKRKRREKPRTEREKSLRAASAARRRARLLGAKGTHTAADIDLQCRSQKGKCWHCGKDLNGEFHIDHLIPLTKGGTNWPNNIVCSCAFCNISKNDRLTQEWNGRLL